MTSERTTFREKGQDNATHATDVNRFYPKAEYLAIEIARASLSRYFPFTRSGRWVRHWDLLNSSSTVNPKEMPVIERVELGILYARVSGFAGVDLLRVSEHNVAIFEFGLHTRGTAKEDCLF